MNTIDENKREDHSAATAESAVERRLARLGKKAEKQYSVSWTVCHCCFFNTNNFIIF
jgi:hypothetical protein